MFDYLPYLSIALVLIGAAGLGWRRLQERKELPQGDPLTVISEWKLTGKIDFGCPELPKDERTQALFFLRVEEYRLLQSLSGTRRVDMRWRKATLAETKHVVSRYNANSVLIFGELPAPVRSASIVPRLAPAEPVSPAALIHDYPSDASAA